jgi:SAM-dependent methyltransferase
MSRLIKHLRSRQTYKANLNELKRQSASAKVQFPFGKPYPCLRDRYQESGIARGHYFNQDLLVARRVFANQPETHVDIGSRIDGFVAHVAAFRPITVLDIRQLPDTIPNVRFVQCDIMHDIPPELVESTDSLSCLHALEHFGLGRYGDPVDYDGYLKGFENLYRILKPGGRLYFSVPMGPQRIEFDAHRVFSLDYLLQLIAPKYDIVDFSYVDDAEELHESVGLPEAEVARSFGCRYGCAIFELIKR